MLQEGMGMDAEWAPQVRQLEEDREIVEKAAIWYARVRGPGLSR